MSSRIIWITTVAALTLTACATQQESPIYQQSTKYDGNQPFTNVANNQTATQSGNVHTVRYDQGYGSTHASTPIVYQSQRAPSAVWASDLPGGYHEVGYQTTPATHTGSSQSGYTETVTVQNRPVQPHPYDYSSQASVSQAQAYPASSTAYTTYASTTSSVASSQIQSAPLEDPVYSAPTDEAYSDDTFGTPGYHAVMAAQNAPAPVQAAPITIAPEPIAPAPQTYTASTPVGTPLYSDTGYTRREIVEGDTVYPMARNLCVEIEEVQNLNNIDGTFNIRLGDTIQLPQSRC